MMGDVAIALIEAEHARITSSPGFDQYRATWLTNLLADVRRAQAEAVIYVAPVEADLRAGIEAGLRAWGRAGGICVTAKMRGEIADAIVTAMRSTF